MEEKKRKIKKVLIVEDMELLQKLWKKSLSGFLVLSAKTLSQAETLFEENLVDLDLIAFDGEVGGSVKNTVSLIKKIATRFPQEKMLAISADPDNNKLLVNAGCKHSIDKKEVAAKIRELLA